MSAQTVLAILLANATVTSILGFRASMLISPELLAEDYGAGRIRPVRLKDCLGQIQPNDANFAHGRLPS
jgi:hypothetical protein